MKDQNVKKEVFDDNQKVFATFAAKWQCFLAQ